MTKIDESKLLRQLVADADLSLMGAARLFQINERTMRRYANGPDTPPRSILLALAAMRAGKVTVKIAFKIATGQDWNG